MAKPIPANPLTKTHNQALFLFARRGSLILVVIDKRNLGVGAQCLFEKTARVLTGRLTLLNIWVFLPPTFAHLRHCQRFLLAFVS
jgi:hypothetical protein